MKDIIHCQYTGGTGVKVSKEECKDLIFTAHDGTNERFTPGDVLCGALGACILTMMSVVAQRKGAKLDGADLTVHPSFDPQNGRLTDVKLDIKLPADTPQALRALYRAAVDACPVHRSLNPEIRFTVNFI